VRFKADQAHDRNIVRVNVCHKSSLMHGLPRVAVISATEWSQKSILAQHKQNRTSLQYIKEGLEREGLTRAVDNGETFHENSRGGNPIG
jgi:hypothetical protein